jgi:hypothetical protein
MTYQELIKALTEAERYIDPIEAAANAYLESRADLVGEFVSKDELLFEGAENYILDHYRQSFLDIGDESTNEAQNAYQNAVDTLCDYGLSGDHDGVSPDTLVAKAIFADCYNIDICS